MFPDLTADQRRFCGVDARLRVGAFAVTIELLSKEALLADEIARLYRRYPRDPDPSIPDVVITLRSSLADRLSRQMELFINGGAPFRRAPARLAVPMLESGMNWFIGTATTRFLLLHAAVVERNGRAIVLPGPSGAGKSTLCAALVARGWRLLSDEFAMVRPWDGLLQPCPRPIALKNVSIQMIRSLMPEAHFSGPYPGTTKGTVAFMGAPADAVREADRAARPVLVVYPSRHADAEASVAPVEKAHSFMALVDLSANYATMLDRGFDTLAAMVETCDHYRMSYHALDQAVALVEGIEPAA